MPVTTMHHGPDGKPFRDMSTTSSKTSVSTLTDEQKEIERLRNLAGTVYAGLGAECNLPERWLDVLSAAANGEPFDTEGLLPFAAIDKATGSAA